MSRSVGFLSPPKDDRGRPTSDPAPEDPASPADSTRSLRHFKQSAAPSSDCTSLQKALVGTAKFTLLYAILGAFLRFVFARYGTAEMVASSAQRRARAVLFALSTLNCCITVVPFATTMRDVWRTWGSLVPSPYASVTRFGDYRIEAPAEATDDGEPTMPPAAARRMLRQSTFICEAITGYLLHDLIMVLPEAHKYPADIFHHLAGLTCGFASLVNLRGVYPFLPVFFTAEFSTIFLNLIWLFREYPKTAEAMFPAGWGATVRDRIAPLCFAGAFGVVRAALFPYMKFKLFTTPIVDRRRGAKVTNVLEYMLGKPATYTLLSLQALQWYWFVMILKKVARILARGSRGREVVEAAVGAVAPAAAGP